MRFRESRVILDQLAPVDLPKAMKVLEILGTIRPCWARGESDPASGLLGYNRML